MIGLTFGSYRTTGRLGQGGMASVYRGVHDVLGHEVAIKVLHDGFDARHSVQKRFLNEAKAVARLQHPGIVRLLEFGVDAGERPYIVMELLRGRSLAQQLAASGRLDELEVVRLGMEMAAALRFAHQSGVVHRDLKPENIFLSDGAAKATVKILDFGIAKHEWNALSTTEVTQNDTLLGTPAYMSPEQCRDPSSVDHRTDIYSLGIVLFRMCTAELPFDGKSKGELIAQQQFVAAPDVRSLVPELSPEIAALIRRCLDKPLHRRLQSMSDVFDRLSAIADRPGSARLTPAPGRATPMGAVPVPETAVSAVTERDDATESSPTRVATTFDSAGSMATTAVRNSEPPRETTPASTRDAPARRLRSMAAFAASAAAAIAVGLLVILPGAGAADAPQPATELVIAAPEPTLATPSMTAIEDATADDAELRAPTLVESCRAAFLAGESMAEQAALCVLAACKAGDLDTAAHHAESVSRSEREGLLEACRANGILLAGAEPATDAEPPASAKRPRRARSRRDRSRAKSFADVEIPLVKGSGGR